MTSPTPERVHTRQGRDRREELLAHASRLILERGLADTRMVDIAEAAGVAKGLVYWYFESKDALLLALVLDVRERLRVAQTTAAAGVDDPLDRLYAGTVASVHFIDEHWNLYRLLQTVTDADERTEALAVSGRVHAADTIELLEEGRDAGVVRGDEDLLVLAHGNQGIVNHFTLAAQRGDLPDIATAAHAAARLVVRAAAASPDLADAAIDRCRPRRARTRRRR